MEIDGCCSLGCFKLSVIGELINSDIKNSLKQKKISLPLKLNIFFKLSIILKNRNKKATIKKTHKNVKICEFATEFNFFKERTSEENAD